HKKTIMTKVTLKTGGTSNGEAQLVKFVENIIVKLAENADLFTDADPSIADLEQAQAKVKQAQADAAYRDKRFVLLQIHAFAALKKIGYPLSHDEEREANGEAAVILAARLNPSAKGVMGHEPAPVPKFIAEEVNVRIPGLTTLKTAYWKGNLAYQFE